jgi:hypothetical protein
MFSSRSRVERIHDRMDRTERPNDHSKSSRKSTDRNKPKRFNYLSNLKTADKQFVTGRQFYPSK